MYGDHVFTKSAQRSSKAALQSNKVYPPRFGSWRRTGIAARQINAIRFNTVAYDVSEQLRTPEEMAAYLDAWLEDAPEDAAGIARALGDIARAKGMTQVARDAGLSRESLYKALGENGNPTFATVLKVAKALGVRFHAQVA